MYSWVHSLEAGPFRFLHSLNALFYIIIIAMYKHTGTLQKQKGYFNPARVISVAALCAYILIEYSKHQ